MSINDYPNIRRSTKCPFCLGKKDLELVACWPCFRTIVKKGDGDAVLDAAEARLERGTACVICGGNHQPRADLCDEAGMERQASKLGSRRWNHLTAHISRINNRSS